MEPGWAVLGYTPRGRTPVSIDVWDAFAAKVRQQASLGSRVCVSTEDFGSASTSSAERIATDLGGDRVHVIAVARRLDRLLPSQWQERIKSHDTLTYEAWLERVLGDDAHDREHRRFWDSHDLTRMFDRWQPVVGSKRFGFLILDESDPRCLNDAFERLLNLPRGLLEVPPSANASLSANATELLRRVNDSLRAARLAGPALPRP